jgi:cytidylate kinase
MHGDSKSICHPMATITIARQVGSGGTYIGQLLANRLGWRYIDNEVLQLAAKALGIDEEHCARLEGRPSQFWDRILSVFSFGPPDGLYAPPPLRPISGKPLFDAETQMMKTIADQGHCVIIGRAGAFILDQHPYMLNVYLHAPLGFRVRRVMAIYGRSDVDEARLIVEEADRLRKRYVTEMTGRDWECAHNYHVAINTSSMPLDLVADAIVEFLKRKIPPAGS